MLQEIETQFQRMEYPPIDVPGDDGPVSIFDAEDKAGEEEASLLRRRVQQLEAALVAAQETQESLVAAADRDALARGRELARNEDREMLLRIGEQVRVALDAFGNERDSYFADVEKEVVRLALGIAVRILHREAQIDPLLLTGAVRVALGQLAESTELCLRVPSAEVDLWQEMLRLMPNLPSRPKVTGDETFGPEECVLETRLGSVDLGVRAQLAEIERGFFDLLEQRPPAHNNDGPEISGMHASRRSA
jgi:flagellar assembly protein FliH